MTESNAQPANDSSQIGAAIAEGIRDGLKQLAPRKVTFGQYDPKSSFHPDKKKAKHLTRECFQNGARLNEATLFDAEIELLNQIKRPGRYLNRKVEVVIREGTDSETVELRYNNATFEQRSDLKSQARNFLEMLKQIVMEQEVAEENEQSRLSARS